MRICFFFARCKAVAPSILVDAKVTATELLQRCYRADKRGHQQALLKIASCGRSSDVRSRPITLAKRLTALKIRVSVVRFRPWPPLSASLPSGACRPIAVTPRRVPVTPMRKPRLAVEYSRIPISKVRRRDHTRRDQVEANEYLRWFSGLLDVDIVVGGYAPFVSSSNEDLL
jgi:hypothetical protein